jgi:hypothetical protein
MAAQKAWYKNAPMDKVLSFTTEKVPKYALDEMAKEGADGVVYREIIDGRVTGFSDVYFNNTAFSSAKQLFVTMGHELVHVSQYAALAGTSANIVTQPLFKEMLEYHAFNYSNTLRGRCVEGAFSFAEIQQMMSSYPQFWSMTWENFPWTFGHSFIYPF